MLSFGVERAETPAALVAVPMNRKSERYATTHFWKAASPTTFVRDLNQYNAQARSFPDVSTPCVSAVLISIELAFLSSSSRMRYSLILGLILELVSSTFSRSLDSKAVFRSRDTRHIPVSGFAAPVLDIRWVCGRCQVRKSILVADLAWFGDLEGTVDGEYCTTLLNGSYRASCVGFTSADFLDLIDYWNGGIAK